ncbi:M48 family metalloprotease [Aquamicrobium sp. LC103]|uniref:M48 family metalloprotease n=1 Tax=Aquamicrobium sp. LC103 TaxID=1120658 RepID=UPI00063E704B|nr:M48 family metalloprotease [Aquamicrobium sp. LC103]TKT79207.1 M48 family metallopeptidase [Aquamicrobium sp. LC103]
MKSRSAAASILARPARFVAAALLAIQSTLLPLSSAQAQQRVPIVRDAEIEALVRDYAAPILKAAGLSRSGIEIVLVNQPSFNAFVAGRRIFINTGALMTAETPNEIIGVLAHEAGHIAGGHQQRLRDQMARAQTMSVVATILGIGAAVAGAASGTQGLAQSGAGLAMGGGEAARRSLLAYQRTEEITADRSAITYLERTGQSARGMLATFERLADGLSLSGARVDPYQISHPVPRERIANLETLARQSRYFDRTDPPALQQRHDLIRAKIAAYTQGQAATSRLFRNDRGSLAARYGDAISTFLAGNPRGALPKIDALIQAQPRNPYFHEMRGEILIKANRPAEAAQSFARALSLDPNRSGIIQIGYGQALLATGQPDQIRKAVSELQTGLSKAREFAAGYRYLAQAHGQLGDIAQAELATAEGHYYSGSIRDAKIFAARAQQKLPQGSPGWLKAQDIINQKQPGR